MVLIRMLLKFSSSGRGAAIGAGMAELRKIMEAMVLLNNRSGISIKRVVA